MSKQIPVNNIQSLNIVHKALLTGQLLFAAIAFYLVYSGTMILIVDKQTDKILQIAVIAVAAAGFFGGNLMFKKKIISLRGASMPANEKFRAYKRAAILHWAMLEAPALFSIICFLLTANYAVLILGIVLIFCFAMLGPSRQKISFQLGLSAEEAEEI